MAWSDAARAAAAEARRLHKRGISGYKTTVRSGHKIIGAHTSRLTRDLAYKQSVKVLARRGIDVKKFSTVQGPVHGTSLITKRAMAAFHPSLKMSPAQARAAFTPGVLRSMGKK